MKRRWFWIIAGLLLAAGVWGLASSHYREAEKRLRGKLRSTVVRTFPEKHAAFFNTLGLVHDPSTPAGHALPAPGGSTVVLIHGLDDPGRVWQSLSPRLIREGFDVWRMHYPNDQPISESARFFQEELKILKARGVSRISIVAHSMGGLVSRELLTHPEMDYRGQVVRGALPRVDTLIMVGTPNQGSQLVRFRLLAEVREQLTRLAQGQGAWLGSILDGAGEAKIDLLPGSRFLNQLNARPRPQGVALLIIAGIAAPWNEGDVTQWIESVDSSLGEDLQAQLESLGRTLIRAAHGLGDGLVPLEATRLPGVAHRTVAGTHLTMIRNISAESRRVPPAVPLIVEQLKAGPPAGGVTAHREPHIGIDGRSHADTPGGR